jgi:phosphoribosylanthranilate isomerase
MTLVKICGLRTIEHALAAAEAGADMLGLVFASSRRQVSLEQATTIAAAVRAAPGGRRPIMVGLFVNEAPARILSIAQHCRLDAIQLSGDEPDDIANDLAGYQLLKAIRLDGRSGEEDWMAPNRAQSSHLLLDAHVPGAYGGTGVLADWHQAADLARRRSIMLAGGLTPENVGAAIQQVRPWGVDVSTGVETNGAKDSAKIRAFVAAAQAADRQLARDQALR